MSSKVKRSGRACILSLCTKKVAQRLTYIVHPWQRTYHAVASSACGNSAGNSAVSPLVLFVLKHTAKKTTPICLLWSDQLCNAPARAGLQAWKWEKLHVSIVQCNIIMYGGVPLVKSFSYAYAYPHINTTLYIHMQPQTREVWQPKEKRQLLVCVRQANPHAWTALTNNRRKTAHRRMKWTHKVKISPKFISYYWMCCYRCSGAWWSWPESERPRSPPSCHQWCATSKWNQKEWR